MFKASSWIGDHTRTPGAACIGSVIEDGLRRVDVVSNPDPRTTGCMIGLRYDPKKNWIGERTAEMPMAALEIETSSSLGEEEEEENCGKKIFLDQFSK